jgi:hypothetical protein
VEGGRLKARKLKRQEARLSHRTDGRVPQLNSRLLLTHKWSIVMKCPSFAKPTISLASELPKKIEFCGGLVILRATARSEAIFFALRNELWLRDLRVGDGERVEMNTEH